MPYSTKKAKEIYRSVRNVGEANTAIDFEIDLNSVRRACRKHKGFLSPQPHITQPKRKELSVNVDDRPDNLPKVLIFDIETSPILARVWGIWQQNVGLSQIKNDWFVLSYSAKWLGVDGIIYDDLRGVIGNEDDKSILPGIWNLLNDADVVITQNGKKFDVKKLNARFVMQGFQPPSGYKHIDTLVIAKRIFGFTSNKLEFMTDKLCKKYKKQKHAKFSGFELWKECLADNIEAWKEMEEYNKYDVLSLEELYGVLAAWDDKHVNFNLYTEGDEHVCRCGSDQFTRNGYAYTAVSKFQKYRCKKCGSETRGRKNLFTKEKIASLRNNILN